MLVDYDNCSTEYIESTTKAQHNKRLKDLQRFPGIEHIRVLEDPKQSYIWNNPNGSPEEPWI